MGSLFSQKTFPLEAQAGEATETAEETLKGASTKVLKCPTERDGRSYKEVLRAGSETRAMSKLSESGAAWKFVKTPEDKQM